MRFFKILASLFILTGIAACANYKVHQSDGLPAISVSTNPIEHRLFFVGDAGEITDGQFRVLKQLRTLVEASDVPSTVVFLGDNIYPVGMPSKKDSVARAIAEAALMRQVEAVADVAHEVVFIQGNHDWEQGAKKGRKSAERQQKFIKKLDLKNVRIEPEDGGCPGPEELELTDEFALLTFDSQWWLQNWENDKDINDDCDIKTRFDFANELIEIVKDNKERRVIMAMHHPLISSGSHNGHFEVKDHLFPLTAINDNLWIPLPVLGSIHPVYRTLYGNVQDQPHPKYQELIDAVMSAANNHDEMVFVSGHQHSMEYHRMSGHHFLVSGSGSRLDPIANVPTMEYGHSAYGVMQLDLRSGGGIDLKVWEPDNNGQSESPAYASNLVISQEFDNSDVTVEYPTSFPDSTTAFISAAYVKGKFHQFLFGERYRDLYDLPVTARNLILADEHGGLEAIKKGGGFQTNSLRFEAPDEHQFVIRSLDKDATKLLPELFQSTFAKDLLQDQFTASHPYAAVVIPPMAESAGIYHTNPEIVYVPRQNELGRYNDDFGESLFLYEERANGDWVGYESFGSSKDLINFKEVIEETIDDHDNWVDQRFVLRNRLFDMFIADWDRHDDQWRWATFDTERGEFYRPIPRDRDQALSSYTGLLHKLAQGSPSLRKMTPLDGDIQNPKWFNLNAAYFDRDFLNELKKDDWIKIARDLQERLTDEVIESSIKSWPKEVFEIQGSSIIEILKERRDNLEKFAIEYYDVLTKRVFIRGTEKEDFIEITRRKGGTLVRVFDSNKAGDMDEVYYERLFYDNETESIEVYGLDGKDVFEVVGSGGSSIKVYLVGGNGKDRFQAVVGAGGGVRSFDTHKKQRGIGMKYKEVDDDFNAYDRKAFHYDFGIMPLSVGYNPDDGVSLGLAWKYQTYKFKKEPWASRHQIFASYAFGSGAYGGGYLGQWRQVIGSAGIEVEAVYEAPSYVENYFGFGNETEQVVDDINYYRVRKRSFRIIPAVTWGNGDDGSNLKLRVGLQSHRVEDTEGRFVTEPDNGLPDDVFEDRVFLLGRVEYFFRSVDNPILTTRGVDFRATAGADYEYSLEELHRFFTTSLSLFYQFHALGQPVLATRLGAEWHGGDYQFYQGARLGAHDNLRGMHKHRFQGERLFYQNIDLRFSLFKWRNYYLPAKMGIMLGFDYGRVWEDEEDSDTWHHAYGGGLWISPFETLLLSLGYHVSDVDSRFEFHMGFFF